MHSYPKDYLPTMKCKLQDYSPYHHKHAQMHIKIIDSSLPKICALDFKSIRRINLKNAILGKSFTDNIPFANRRRILTYSFIYFDSKKLKTQKTSKNVKMENPQADFIFNLDFTF